MGQASLALDLDFSVARWLMLLCIFKGEVYAAGLIRTLKFNLVELLEQDARHATHFRLLAAVWTLFLTQVPSVDTH